MGCRKNERASGAPSLDTPWLSVRAEPARGQPGMVELNLVRGLGTPDLSKKVTAPVTPIDSSRLGLGTYSPYLGFACALSTLGPHHSRD